MIRTSLVSWRDDESSRCTGVSQIGTTGRPAGFILKVMHRKAYDYAEIRKQVYVLDPE